MRKFVYFHLFTSAQNLCYASLTEYSCPSCVSPGAKQEIVQHKKRTNMGKKKEEEEFEESSALGSQREREREEKKQVSFGCAAGEEE